MSETETGWRATAELENGTIESLISVVGAEVFASLKTAFETDLRQQAAAYHDARAAGDDVTGSQCAHALRGAALNIGLARLGALAGALEAGDRSDETQLDAVLESALARLFAAG